MILAVTVCHLLIDYKHFVNLISAFYSYGSKYCSPLTLGEEVIWPGPRRLRNGRDWILTEVHQADKFKPMNQVHYVSWLTSLVFFCLTLV